MIIGMILWGKIFFMMQSAFTENPYILIILLSKEEAMLICLDCIML